MKIYFSRWTGDYNTNVDIKIKEAIMKKFNITENEIIDPSKFSHKSHSMEYYLYKLDEADVIVFYESLPGYVTAGVYEKIKRALYRRKPVYKILPKDDTILFQKVDEIDSCTLSVVETRLLNEAINRYEISKREVIVKISEVSKKYRKLNCKEVLILSIAILLAESSGGLLTLKAVLKRKFPRDLGIDTFNIMKEIGMIKVDKLGRRIYSDEDRKRVLTLAGAGTDIKSISKVLGIPISTVRRWVYKEFGHGEYRKYSGEQYEKAMELLKKGYSIKEVASLLGIKISQIKNWKYRGVRPPKIKFLPRPSSSLAYVIGTLLSDGSVVRKGNYKYVIQLKVKDYDYAIGFSKHLSKLLNKSLMNPRKLGDGRWEVTYYSSGFYDWWQSQSLNSLKQYIEHCGECIRAFLRGFMDGDACSSKEGGVIVANTNLEILMYVRELLNLTGIRTGKIRKAWEAGKEVYIKGRKYKATKPLYTLYVNKKDFVSKIGFSIARKNI